MLEGDDPGGGAFALFLRPHPGEFAHFFEKMLMPGDWPGGGGRMGTAGIDWCINAPCRPYSQTNPLRVIFRSLPVSEIPGGSWQSHPFDPDFALHVQSQAALHIFILHEHVHAARLVIFSAEELGTMSKNNLRGVALVIRCIWTIKLSYPSSSLGFINICVTYGHCVTTCHFLEKRCEFYKLNPVLFLTE